MGLIFQAKAKNVLSNLNQQILYEIFYPLWEKPKNNRCGHRWINKYPKWKSHWMAFYAGPQPFLRLIVSFYFENVQQCLVKGQKNYWQQFDGCIRLEYAFFFSEYFRLYISSFQFHFHNLFAKFIEMPTCEFSARKVRSTKVWPNIAQIQVGRICLSSKRKRT